MTQHTTSKVISINRRRALAAATLAALVPVAARAASIDAPASSAPALPDLAGMVPASWDGWRSADLRDGASLSQYLSYFAFEAFMDTNNAAMELEHSKVSFRSEYASSEDVEHAASRLALKEMDLRVDQAAVIGFALAMTREYAKNGPEAWYCAALAYAGIRPVPEEETKAIFAKVNRINAFSYVVGDAIEEHPEAKGSSFAIELFDKWLEEVLA